jgi:hypothetical protein
VNRFRTAFVAAGLVFAGVAFAQSDEDCLDCHGGAKDSTDPIEIDLARLPDSVHGQFGMSCVECHMDLMDVELPHEDELEPVDCSMCHDDAAEAMAEGVHGAAKGADGETVGCASCHGVHDIHPSSDRASPTHMFNVPATCSACHDGHATDGPVPAPDGTAPHVGGDYADGIHGEALLGKGLNVAPSCATCHGPHRILASDDPESRTHRSQIAGSCGSCHEGILELYSESVHGRKSAEGHGHAAICTDCHAAHLIDHTDVDSWHLDIVLECGDCHEQSVATFRDTFHGKVTDLGFARVATCADCHGSHDILPKDDAHSRITGEKLVATCGACHTESSAQFVKYQPHPEPDNVEANAPLYWSTKLMKLLLASVFAFFFVHTTLWLPRSWIARLKHGRAQDDRA